MTWRIEATGPAADPRGINARRERSPLSSPCTPVEQCHLSTGSPVAGGRDASWSHPRLGLDVDGADVSVGQHPPRMRFSKRVHMTGAAVPRLSLAEAVRLHARRFRRARVSSLLTLTTASERHTADRAVATVTVVPNLPQALAWMAVLLAGWALLVPALIVAFIDPRWAPLPILAFLGFVPLAWASGRRLQAWILWGRRHGGAWLLADVTSDEDRSGAGRRVMEQVIARAEVADRRVVLGVASDNTRAVDLYLRNGFVDIGGRRKKRKRTRRAKD
jgi:ribosomal protein S18 acetylase RimI-like enzyme